MFHLKAGAWPRTLAVMGLYMSLCYELNKTKFISQRKPYEMIRLSHDSAYTDYSLFYRYRMEFLALLDWHKVTPAYNKIST